MEFGIALQILIVLTISKYVMSNYIDRGYYWRDYKWTIPADAIPAGKDSNEQQTYIGQAYMHGDGTVVVQIFPEAKEIFGSSYGLKKAQNVVKILCSKNKERFSWKQTNYKYYHVNVTSENPVIGGFNHREPHKGMLHIGRIIHHVVVRIGSIEGYLENAYMNYVHGTTLQRAEDFEVFLYNRD